MASQRNQSKSRTSTPRSPFREALEVLRRGGAVLLWALLLGHVGVLRADDRELLRESSGDPYVFILLDTSGSMHWEIGDTLPTMRSDSPDSKMYQAKQALFQVADNLTDISFGFGTFNQDRLRVVSKHWAYEADADGVIVDVDTNGDPLWTYPEEGDEHVFGRIYDCNFFGFAGDSELGCDSSTPAPLTDDWSARRMQLFPKLDEDGTDVTTFYIQTSVPGNTNKRYSVTFTRVSGTIGDATMVVNVRVQNTNGAAFDQNVDVTFNRVGQFLSWDQFAQRHNGGANDQEGFFEQQDFSDNPIGSDIQAQFATFHSTCTGWEPNTDFGDAWNGIDLKAPNSTVNTLSYGDVIPLNWADRNVDAIKRRLAPNLLLGETVPDFSNARYFQDTSAIGQLDLIAGVKAANGTVVLPWGSTPLGRSIRSFYNWYAGWRTAAAANDPDWACKDVYLLILTDGLESCSSASYPGFQAARLKALGVNTYAVGYGVEASSGGDTLDNIALAGGTGEPFRPDNVADLVDTLEFIFSQIKQESASFASAAVPSVQANVADKIFLTSFTPITGNSVWDGHVDAYLKPLPLTVSGLPDRDRVCTSTSTAACRLWDAGEELENQAPDATDVNGSGVLTDPHLGSGENQRRLFYAHERNNVNRVPLGRAPFWADSSTPANDWNRIIKNLDIDSNPGSLPAAQLALAKEEATEIMKETLLTKEGTITVTDAMGNTTTVNVDYVLGDIFHSDPLVLSGPSNPAYFSTDFNRNDPPTECDDSTNPDPGYQCFVDKHFYRRKMLLVASNDGQIHAFDAGVLREEQDGDEVIREFDNGTGREIFSVIPNSALLDVKDLTISGLQRFIMDGPLVADDVFIDPSHGGTPTVTEREWRTVVFTGMREGGRAVVALDVTQPDELGASIGNPLTNGGRDRFNIPQQVAGTDATVDDYVPSCWEESASVANTPADPDCGTLPFPYILWEFDDVDPATLQPRDEDGNSNPDLGFTWSKPNTGVIRILDSSGDPEDRFVAIFGGGLDPTVEQVTPGAVGNWIYMVDVETGKILYKRSVVGAVPSEPAAVNTDGDLYLDTIYAGTVSGYLYKIDISTPFALDASTGRVNDDPDNNGIGDWDPFQIFYTGGRPIFFPPSVFFSSELNLFGLGFSTGDREDLWRDDDYDGDMVSDGGRFYVMLDDGFFMGQTGLPKMETDLAQISLTGSNSSANLLAQGGWHFDLVATERAITPTVTISGITLFNTFIPLQSTAANLCARGGESRSYVVNVLNGTGFLPPSSTGQPNDRFFKVDKFVTTPFIDSGTTKNEIDPNDPNPPIVADNCPPQLIEEFKGIQPDSCRYGTAIRRLQVVRQDTGLQCIAPIPVCIQPHNWTGF